MSTHFPRTRTRMRTFPARACMRSVRACSHSDRVTNTHVHGMSESGNGPPPPPPPLAAQISPQNFIRGHLPKRGETRADGGEEKKTQTKNTSKSISEASSSGRAIVCFISELPFQQRREQLLCSFSFLIRRVSRVSKNTTTTTLQTLPGGCLFEIEPNPHWTPPFASIRFGTLHDRK